MSSQLNKLNPSVIAIACQLMFPSCAFAQLPAPTYGWNLGNTMEPPCGVGCWGPPPTQALINAVAIAGFNTIRIPCAWDSHANQSTYQIDPTYMAQVKQVVDWCIADNLYVIVNDHWDDGWLENNIGTSVDPTINAKMNSYWTQIATAFASYDNRLLFAGANEPNVSTAAQMSTLLTYYNTFISAVRSTGGNNTNRWLVVQGPNTDIDTTYNLMNTLPTDPTPGRLMVEVHYYSPYQFCLMSSDANWGNMFYFWGQGYHSATLTTRNSTWGEEAYVDAEFQKMTDKFISHGVPMMLGEFMAMERTTAAYPDLTGANVNLHLAARTYFDKYVVTSANSHGLKPFYWDTPGGAQLFNWNTGALSDPDGVRALTGGAALPPPSNTPPVLAAISNYTVNVGQTVAFTASATDTDQPPQTLTFSLSSAPSNANLDANTGAFSWRPLVSQASTMNLITLKVADNGSPILSATRGFTVTVNPLTAPLLTPTNWSTTRLTLQVSGQSGPDYAAEVSTNLADWTTVFTTNSPPMPFTWVVTNAGALPVQFYRIKVGPPLP
jgi:aryl-phospho-beta-D-glucosidase BglC (GH1 family)